MNPINHERDLVSFSFLMRNGASREKREVENSREKWTRLKYYYLVVVPGEMIITLSNFTSLKAEFQLGKGNANHFVKFHFVESRISVR